MIGLRSIPRFVFPGIAAGLLVFAAACGGSSSSNNSSSSGGSSSSSSAGGSDAKSVAGYPLCPATGANLNLTGAGSTFDFPLFSKWTDEYQKLCNVKVNYQSVGSGAGISQITAKTVDFGASDGVMTDQQIADAAKAGGPIEHVAITAGATAVTFNLPGITSLKLDGPTLADIYLGNIKKWNDPKITALNSGVNLPNADIAVVHRSDGSGTTFIFTNYLSKVSPDWNSKVGSSTAVNWPTGVGGQGSEGVSGQVKQIPGGIGYVELAYAKQNNLPFASMKNKSGAFIDPSTDSATAAMSGITIPADMKIVITDSSTAAAYPITGFSWVLAYTNQPDAAKGKTLASYLWWQIHDGQKDATSLFYAPLSPDATKAAEAEVLALQCGGSPCLSK